MYTLYVFHAAPLSSFTLCLEGQPRPYRGREHWLCPTQSHALSDLRDSAEGGAGSASMLQPNPHAAEATAARGLHACTESQGDTARRTSQLLDWC